MQIDKRGKMLQMFKNRFRYKTLQGALFAYHPPFYIDNGFSEMNDSVIAAEIMHSIEGVATTDADELSDHGEIIGVHWCDISYAWHSSRHALTTEMWAMVLDVVEPRSALLGTLTISKPELHFSLMCAQHMTLV
jgi:hypothetical protein